MRRRLAHQGFGADHGFRWRGGEISRLEGLSGAVFAFAVTLLVVSLEVPRTFDELLVVLRGFFAFAVCFSILFWVWYDHYRFFRRYGLADGVTTLLTGALLFIGIQSFALNVLIGLASIVIVAVGGPEAAFWSGMTYMLIMPVQLVNGRLMRTRIRRAATSTQEPAAS